MATQKQFGLIGKNIGYSFSKNYFATKFENEKIEGCSYENFDLETIFEFKKVLKNKPNLKGLNVTIPYKEAIIPFLGKMSKKAKKIGAVNTIRITKKGFLKGYNTDYYGFQKALTPLLNLTHKKALILGTGGASKAVAFALKNLNIEVTFVSRENKENCISYDDLDEIALNNNQIIINCTPLGTFPNITMFPNIPYQFLSAQHLAFDLIYNPEQTVFLQKASKQGATTENGFKMLEFQAEKSWQIWNK